jgi:hypothetical protein
LVSHQVDGLCDRSNIDARLKALYAASENRSHIGMLQNLFFNHVFKEREGNHPIGDCNALRATAEEVDHGQVPPSFQTNKTHGAP